MPCTSSLVVGLAVPTPHLSLLPWMMELPKVILVSFQPKVKLAEATVVLASSVMALTISSQSMELEAGIWSSVPQEKRPLSDQSSLEMAALSQSAKPAPKYCEAEARPITSKSPETETLPKKSALPDMEAVPPTSKVAVVSPPALIPTRLLPLTSKLVETLVPPLKVQKPVMVWAILREAGPPLPQSRLMIVSDVPDAVSENLPESKLSILAIACTVAPPSSVLTAAVVQPNLPVALSHCKKLALAQFVKPEPYVALELALPATSKFPETETFDKKSARPLILAVPATSKLVLAIYKG